MPCFLLSIYQHKLIHVLCWWRLELPLQCQYTSTRLCGITSQAVNFIISNVLQVWQWGRLELGCAVLWHGWFNANGSCEQSKDDRDSIWISTDKEASGVWWWLPANWKCLHVWLPALSYCCSSTHHSVLLHDFLCGSSSWKHLSKFFLWPNFWFSVSGLQEVLENKLVLCGLSCPQPRISIHFGFCFLCFPNQMAWSKCVFAATWPNSNYWKPFWYLFL